MTVKIDLQYVPARGARIKAEQAEVYGRRIEYVSEQVNRPFGGVTPEDLVTDGRDPESPLSDYFEWDDQWAGNQYRLWQARYLLVSIHIVETVAGEPSTTRQRVNLVIEEDSEPAERAYYAIEVVDHTSELRDQYLPQAIRELTRWLRKWRRYEELAEQVALVEEAIG